MKKYIGIRGHRGAGKNTISYLLGQTINFILTSSRLTEEQRIELYKPLYKQWCDDYISDEQSTDLHSRFVYLDSFGDTPKMLVSLLTNIPVDYIYSDYYKDHCVVNIGSFRYEVFEKDIPYTLYTADQLLESVQEKHNKGDVFSLSEVYMTLREFIIYYASVTSIFLGRDIWVKSKRADEERLDELDIDTTDKYIIFTDLKAPTEVTYIKDRQGVIIRVQRPKNKKKDKGVDSLDKDIRVDYDINIDNIYNLQEEIYNIAKSVINKQ